MFLVVFGIQGQLVQTQRGLASCVGVVRIGADIVGDHFLSFLAMLLPWFCTLQAYQHLSVEDLCGGARIFLGLE